MLLIDGLVRRFLYVECVEWVRGSGSISVVQFDLKW